VWSAYELVGQQATRQTSPYPREPPTCHCAMGPKQNQHAARISGWWDCLKKGPVPAQPVNATAHTVVRR